MGLKLIEGWQDAWRLASVRLAAIVAVITGALTGHPELLLGLLPYLPDGPWRIVASGFIAAIVFIVPTLTRLLQKKPCPEGTEVDAITDNNATA